jgi:DNA (cytosine-5)-methyltransferase 1
LLWASPECTHHSNARGSRPRSDQSRASAWLILKWLSELYVSRVIIENVPEFLTWGPLDDAGRPIPSKKGKTFRAFATALRSLGYTVDWRILTAADYGDPTTRRRLFVQAVKGRKKIIWPEVTHIDAIQCPDGYSPWRPARDIIDWSITGQSIFDRKRPLAAATMRRIAAGIDKYWGDYAKPFLAVLYGSNDTRSLDIPFPTVTTSGAHHALIEPLILGQQSCAAARTIKCPLPTVATAGAISLVQPFITRYQGSHGGGEDGNKRNHELNNPLPTVDTSNRYGIVEPILVEYYGNGGAAPVSAPVKTITTKDRFGLLEPFMLPNEGFYRGNKPRSLDQPLSTVTASRGAGGIVLPSCEGLKLDIRFRMLKPHELARAQGFPDEYKILGTAAEQTKQIGNAVPVNTARALVLAALREGA